MSASKRVVVIGGGVIGATSAWYLREAGCDVTLIDQKQFGSGCSHGNCGYVCPSHVLPLATPGALWNTLKTLVARNSPLKVRWRLDPALWRWFWQFARKCNERDMLRSATAIQSLLVSSRSLYDGLFAQLLTDVEWETSGLLFVYLSQREMDHYAATDELLRTKFQLGAKRYDGPQLSELEPALKPGIAGAWHYTTDGHLRPDKLMQSWRSVLSRAGVEIREACQLTGFDREGSIVRAVQTSTGPIAADQVVVATGAWTPQLRAQLQTSIPIEPGKGYSLVMPKPSICPKISMIFEEHRVAITPLATTYRIGSTMEFAGYDTSIRPERLKLLTDGAAIYLREPVATPTIESWFGWRPMTPDSLPLIGRLPRLTNVTLAAGHGMLGLSMAPGTGKLVSQIVTGAAPHIDPLPYAVERAL